MGQVKTWVTFPNSQNRESDSGMLTFNAIALYWRVSLVYFWSEWTCLESAPFKNHNGLDVDADDDDDKHNCDQIELM